MYNKTRITLTPYVMKRRSKFFSLGLKIGENTKKCKVKKERKKKRIARKLERKKMIIVERKKETKKQRIARKLEKGRIGIERKKERKKKERKKKERKKLGIVKKWKEMKSSHGWKQAFLSKKKYFILHYHHHLELIVQISKTLPLSLSLSLSPSVPIINRPLHVLSTASSVNSCWSAKSDASMIGNQ